MAPSAPPDAVAHVEGGFLHSDEDFESDLTAVVTEGDNIKGSDVFKCEICDKKCISSRGFKRHQTIKHKKNVITLDTNINSYSDSSVLQTEEFISIVENCADICKNDLCLPENIRNEFCNFKLSSDNTKKLWVYIEPKINKFCGNAEKFFSSFYGLLQENLLPQKFNGDITVTNILMQEIANHLFISFSKSKSECKTGKPDRSTSKVISIRDIKALQYIAGYVIHKLYQKFKLKANKKSMDNYFQQYISILFECKVCSDDTQLLVNSKDRGGLWKVNTTMLNIFMECERIFRSFTLNFQSSLNCRDIVREMQSSFVFISSYDSICYNVKPEVNREICFNLLENILTLFTRVRSFSYAKDIIEKHRLKLKKSKSHSLRTEIKKASSRRDMGH